MAVPLLLLDLDNTLVDRASAFRRWAVRLVAGYGRGPELVEWLIHVDRDGLESRGNLADAIIEQFGLCGADREALLEQLHLGMVEHLELDPSVVRALGRARAAGWTPVVVSNGTVKTQERKLRRTGLASHLAGWVISEDAGSVKPERGIFDRVSRQFGLPLTGAWMIGDSAEADVGGAHRSGLSSVWLHRSRRWTIAEFAPTHTADSCSGAIMTAVLAADPF